jgi:hypothetical protein
MIGVVLIGFVLFAAASLALYRVNDRIVWDVCRRENRLYTSKWSLVLYWQWRTSVSGWYSDAKRAGLLVHKAAASVAVVLLTIGFVAAGIIANAPG